MTTFFFFNILVALNICSDTTSTSATRRRWSDVGLDEPVENPFDLKKNDNTPYNDNALIDYTGMFVCRILQVYIALN